MHFSAEELHKGLLERIKNNSRVKIMNKNIEDPEKVDSDFVLVCSGSPKKLKENEYIVLKEIPVNSVYVVQCD
jgi:hypothetical protein